MTTQQLKAVATGKNEVTEKPKTLAHLLASGSVQAQIKAALPRHMTSERMARIATTEMRKIPKLAQCDPMSFLGAVIQCAQLGLEPGNALGHVYILPFDKRKKVNDQWITVKTEAQVIIGYRGMIELARRSGQINSIDARAVYEGDEFHCELGLDARVIHKPDWQNPNRSKPEKLIFVYAVAKLKGEGVQFDVMSRAEVDHIRSRSKSGNEGPWVTDYAAMAVKSVVRRLFKFLPVSIEMQQAVGLDEMADAGLAQNNGAIIDGQFNEIGGDIQLQGQSGSYDGPDKGEPISMERFKEMLVTASDAQSLDIVADYIGALPDENQAEAIALVDAVRKTIPA